MDIMGILASIGKTLFYIIIMAIAGGIIIVLLTLEQYKHKIVIDKETRNGKFTLIKRWKKVIEDDGTIWLKMLFDKTKHGFPDPDAIKMTKKGKFIVEAYERDGSLIYKKDTNNPDSSYEPLKSNERILYRNQMVIQVIPFIALMIIIVVAFSYWGEVTAGAASVGTKLDDTAEHLEETTLILKEIIQREQIIRDRQDKPPS